MNNELYTDQRIPSAEKRRDTAIRSTRRKEKVSNYDQLPVALNADQVSVVLGISRSGAYNLMRSKGFPTLFIGKRMIVPKDKLLAWMNAQVSA